MEMNRSRFALHLPHAAFTASLLLAAPIIFAHADASATSAATAHAHAHAAHSTDEHAFGKAGNPRQITRTIAVDMEDTMRFSPPEIRVRQGETIKFVVSNRGQLTHEMVLGRIEQLQAHGASMGQNPGMRHDEPYLAQVEPGSQRQIIWHFTQAGEFNYGCLQPGHLEAGMLGKIIVVKGKA